jgi:hypothetical protein
LPAEDEKGLSPGIAGRRKFRAQGPFFDGRPARTGPRQPRRRVEADDVNLILYLKELWCRRAIVALSIFVAAAISILAVFQVSVFPPSISKRAQVEAHGSIEILVDASDSPIADSRRDLTGLTARAGVFARYMAGGNVIRLIARAAGVPVKQIDVAGAAPLPGEAPGAQEVEALHPYGIAIGQAGELPIVTIETRAPTIRKARALAASAPAAVRQVVSSVQEQQGTPARKRVQFRALGPAQAWVVDDALGKKIALALFVVLFGLSILAIFGLPRLVRAWRAAEPDARSLGPDEERQSSEVLRLPAGRAGESGADDREATRIGQGEP